MDEVLGDMEESRLRVFGLMDSVVQEFILSEVLMIFEYSEFFQVELNLVSDLGRVVYVVGVGEFEVMERKKRRMYK